MKNYRTNPNYLDYQKSARLVLRNGVNWISNAPDHVWCNVCLGNGFELNTKPESKEQFAMFILLIGEWLYT